MSLLLKEYCGFKPIMSETAPVKLNEADSSSSLFEPIPGTLMVEIEGIHAYPFHTRNFTRYMPECLKASAPKWTNPYLKPLIKHHNDQNGEIIGRIYDATYTEQTSLKDVGGLIFTVAVPDVKAANEVSNRLLETTSIGVATDDVRCSICGHKIINAEDGCPEGHIRGQLYEGERCYWDIYQMEPKELSYVIVPSDPYAMNKRVYKIGTKANALKESEATSKINLKENNGGPNPEMDLQKELETAKAEIEQLKAKLKEAEDAAKVGDEIANTVTDLQAKNAELQAVIDKINANLKDLETKASEALKAKDEAVAAKAEAEQQAVAAKEEAAVAAQEKEAAENNGIKIQESFRKFVETNLAEYRKLCGKSEIDSAEMAARSFESLQDSLKDLKEELKISAVVNIKEHQVPNPSLPPDDNTPGKVEKNDDYKCVDLHEGLEKLFTGAIG